MRPGNRWDGEAASPVAAAVYSAVIALALGYLLNFALGRVGMWLVHTRDGMFSPGYLMRAALNLYAEQHVPLVGSGTLASELGPTRIEAALTLPLTLLALIPIVSLMIGGYAAARSRATCGRWAAIAPALAGGLLYTAVLAVAAGVVSARFTTVALPEIVSPTMSTQFNPPQIAFKPSAWGTLGYCSILALLSTYLGALIAVRSSAEPGIAGKWWACAKAMIVLSLVIQLTVAGAALVWSYRADVISDYSREEFVGILPSIAGIGYSMVHGATLSYGMGDPAVQATHYQTDVELYMGIFQTAQGKTEYKPPNPQVLIAAAVAALLVLFSGRLAVVYGSRDGSLPTAARITILQITVVVLQMLFCSLSLRAGGLGAYLQPAYGGAILLAVVGIFTLSLIGAHWANTRYVGRLSGFPRA